MQENSTIQLSLHFAPKGHKRSGMSTQFVPIGTRLASIGSLKGNGKGYNLCELLFPFREGIRYWRTGDPGT